MARWRLRGGLDLNLLSRIRVSTVKASNASTRLLSCSVSPAKSQFLDSCHADRRKNWGPKSSSSPKTSCKNNSLPAAFKASVSGIHFSERMHLIFRDNDSHLHNGAVRTAANIDVLLVLIPRKIGTSIGALTNLRNPISQNRSRQNIFEELLTMVSGLFGKFLCTSITGDLRLRAPGRNRITC